LTPPASPSHDGADAPEHQDEINEPEDSPASLLELPDSIRKTAIEAFLSRRSRPNISQSPTVESYSYVNTSIPEFNKVFPLGNIVKRWKEGIPLFPSGSHSVGRIRDHVSPTKTLVIQNLLAAEIIVRAPRKRSAYLSNFFLVQKANAKVRPIMDYSHLGKHLKSPHFVLPSVYQLIRNKFLNFNNLFYIKIDLKAAFYNIPLKETSQYITTFIYDKVRYQMKKLPMGLSLSPFIMQRFSNAIINKYKHLCAFSWAHIDDMIFAHKSPTTLKQVATELVKDLSAINWKISWKKSVLVPSRGIRYLGAYWGQHSITRDHSVTQRLYALWQNIRLRTLPQKEIQRIRGTFNYYFAFAGHFHSVINQILVSNYKHKYDHIINYLIRTDSIKLQSPPEREITAYSDASMYRIAAVFPEKTLHHASTARTIAINELKAANLAINHFISNYNINSCKLNLFVDNLNVLYFIKKGSCKWQDLCINSIFYFIKRFTLINLSIKYIPSGLNPADEPSRFKPNIS